MLSCGRLYIKKKGIDSGSVCAAGGGRGRGGSYWQQLCAVEHRAAHLRRVCMMYPLHADLLHAACYRLICVECPSPDLG